MTKYKRSFSSGDKEISTGNDVITFDSPNDVYDYNNTIEFNSVEYLSFETFNQSCKIKLNDEETVHFIDVNSIVVFADFMIYKLTIIDADVEYYYTAFATK